MRLFFVLIGFVALAASGVADAMPTSPFTRMRAEYVRLRNIDPTGDSPIHRSAWQQLASRMRSALIQPGGGSEHDSTRLMAVDTHLRLYRGTRQPSYLTTAKAMIGPLVQNADADSPASAVASQALLLYGDLHIYEGFKDSAAQIYTRVVSIGNRSEALRANQRLQGIRNGTHSRFLPSLDHETPKLVQSRGKRLERIEAPVIVLDPGHGGEDAGAVSTFGGEEKEVSLDIARRVKVLLERRHGMTVHLTRDDDRFVPLARRTAFANRKGAAVFISLHVNASVSHDAEGLEVYYLDNTNDEASKKLAERENGVAEGDGVDDLSFMLSDLIQSGKLEDSVVLSRTLDASLRRSVQTSHKGLRSLGVKKAPFFVLVGAHMPCSLLEMFFIDHPVEGRNFQKESFRTALAVGIVDGIGSFLNKK